MAVFALTRIPGVLPENFSAAYALVFCAGAFLPGRLAWWLPLATMAITDLLLNLHYRYHLGWDVFSADKLVYLGGSCTDTDQSARLCTNIALATRPFACSGKPGMGVDEALMIVGNEMQRVLAICKARGSL